MLDTEPIVLRISSSNRGARFTLALLVVVVGGLSFVALYDPKFWFAAAFFALPVIHLGAVVFFPHDILFEVDPHVVRWTVHRGEESRLRADEVAAVYVSWKIADDPGSLQLTSGKRLALPDTVFMEAEADPERLCAAWAALWPSTPIFLRKYPRDPFHRVSP